MPDFDGEWDGIDDDGIDDDVEPLGDWEDVDAGATQWDLKPRSAAHSPAVKRSEAGEGHSLVKRKSRGARITWCSSDRSMSLLTLQTPDTTWTTRTAGRKAGPSSRTARAADPAGINPTRTSWSLLSQSTCVRRVGNPADSFSGVASPSAAAMSSSSADRTPSSCESSTCALGALLQLLAVLTSQMQAEQRPVVRWSARVC